MSWHYAWLLVALLAGPALAAVCPESCVCSTTRDGLHRVSCSDLGSLYKFTLRQKHHNINILDLSHNNITKLSHELDRLTEVVTLDLSTNGITQLNKFLNNAKKLVHLNLANNRIQRLSLIHLPTSVSSLDLTNNLLKDVPYDIEHLKGLEHLEMEGNPLDCSCDNIMIRERLLHANVYIDDVKCHTPENIEGRSWLELKAKDVCKVPKSQFNYLDMMMGDQPIDAVQIGQETTALKSMPLTASSDLEDGHIIKEGTIAEDDDNLVFMKVDKPTASIPSRDIEGSGEEETTSTSDILITPKRSWESHSSFIEAEEKTEDPLEGSGFMDIYEGSGFGLFDETSQKPVETTTAVYSELYTGPVTPIFFDDNTLEFLTPKTPTVYAGGPDWHSRSSIPEVTETAETNKVGTTQTTRDTTISEHIRVTQAAEINESPSSSEKPGPHKTGTYVCIAIIVVLLVGLIGFAIAKGQIRKSRDRRLLRQQKRDVEQASKEMVDMNKSLLGKAAVLDSPMEKKVNGKYELVPTHEKIQKSENGDLNNGIKRNEANGKRTDSPRDTNQNKSSSVDNNLIDEINAQIQDTSFDSAQPSIDSRKDTHSLSSEDIFVPLNDDDTTRLNGTTESDASHPLLNGDNMTIDTDFLSPREYVPVYSPDMGRVRIKLSETPKPTTPVLVTRSRSNAGDIIITPAVDANKTQSTT